MRQLFKLTIILIIVMLLWSCGGGPPSSKEEAEEYTTGTWITQKLVFDRYSRTVFSEDGTFAQYMATDGDDSWGNVYKSGSWSIKKGTYSDTGNSYYAIVIGRGSDAYSYALEGPKKARNRAVYMYKGDRKKP
jgi:hypothetical protein